MVPVSVTGIPPSWQTGWVETPAGRVPRVATSLGWQDRLGGWKVRWRIGRAGYRVDPGLYAAGSPSRQSPVLVTANFKMSFDRLRSVLKGLDVWILVLDTKGINVWCAAGKGTFGTDELIRRTSAVQLEKVVAHKKLVLPQLGAPGVSAHEVREKSGWRVRYGPIRAEDLPAFLGNGMKATLAMRRVRFPLKERLAVAPVDLVLALKYLLMAAAVLTLLSGLGSGWYSLERMLHAAPRIALMLFAAGLAGTVIGPALLPWLPGRAFSLKGFQAGLAAVLILFVVSFPAAVARDGVSFTQLLTGAGFSANWAEAVGWLLLIPAIASFLTMNFTGASTFTSLSGVRREMRLYVPVQAAVAVLGLVFWITGRFV